MWNIPPIHLGVGSCILAEFRSSLLVRHPLAVLFSRPHLLPLAVLFSPLMRGRLAPAVATQMLLFGPAGIASQTCVLATPSSRWMPAPTTIGWAGSGHMSATLRGQRRCWLRWAGAGPPGNLNYGRTERRNGRHGTRRDKYRRCCSACLPQATATLVLAHVTRRLLAEGTCRPFGRRASEDSCLQLRLQCEDHY